MNKKMIIITVIVGLVSFGGTFAAGMLKKAKHVENKENLQPLPERPEVHNPTEEKQEK